MGQGSWSVAARAARANSKWIAWTISSGHFPPELVPQGPPK